MSQRLRKRARRASVTSGGRTAAAARARGAPPKERCNGVLARDSGSATCFHLLLLLGLALCSLLAVRSLVAALALDQPHSSSVIKSATCSFHANMQFHPKLSKGPISQNGAQSLKSADTWLSLQALGGVPPQLSVRSLTAGVPPHSSLSVTLS